MQSLMSNSNLLDQQVDMAAIKQEFNRMYGKTLASFVKGDTSGDYKKVILGIIGEQ